MNDRMDRRQAPPVPTRENPQIIGLDAVRFLAAAIVMFYHLRFWRNGDLPPVEHQLSRALWVGWVGVPIFFVLSGIVIAFSARNSTPTGFAQSRFLRLAPGVWICATLSLVIGLGFMHPADPLLLARFWQTVVLLPVGNHIDVVYWTLTVEVAFYALIFLVLRVRGFSAVVPVMVAVGLLSAAYEGTRILQDLGQASVLPGFWLAAVTAISKKTVARLLLLPHGIYFSLGVLIGALQRDRRRLLLWVWACFFTAVCFLNVRHEAGRYLVRNAMTGVASWGPALVWLAATAAMVGSLAANRWLSGRSAGLNATLRFLGLLTFPVYLLHNTNGLLLEGFLMEQGCGRIAAFWITVGMIFALAAAVTALLEPWLRRRLKDFIGRGLARSQIAPVSPVIRAEA